MVPSSTAFFDPAFLKSRSMRNEAMRTLALCIVLGSIGVPGSSLADEIAYRGRLFSNGAPYTQEVTLRFCIVDALGTKRWPAQADYEEHVLTPIDGRFTARLGLLHPLDSSALDSKEDLFIDVTVNSISLGRQMLLSTPRSIVAEEGLCPYGSSQGNKGMCNWIPIQNRDGANPISNPVLTHPEALEICRGEGGHLCTLSEWSILFSANQGLVCAQVWTADLSGSNAYRVVPIAEPCAPYSRGLNAQAAATTSRHFVRCCR